MQIIVVADQDENRAAQLLVHEISKQPEHSGVLWSTEHFNDNQVQVTGKHPFVFIGWNETSEVFISMFKRKNKQDFGNAGLRGKG